MLSRIRLTIHFSYNMILFECSIITVTRIYIHIHTHINRIGQNVYHSV